jgi:hypothetical protein
MRYFLSLLAVVGAATLAGVVADQWTGGGAAQAQSRGKGSSACIQNCMNVRNWPAEQCRQLCRGRR